LAKRGKSEKICATLEVIWRIPADAIDRIYAFTVP
jgi:hypothetical protein